MKQKWCLKYLIIIFAFVVSFFMLSNNSVSAADKSLYLKLQASGDDYTIVGGGLTCGTDETCVSVTYNEEKFVFPSEYNNKKITSIADGSMSGYGVLNELKNEISGVVTIGANIKTIGTRAFFEFTKIQEIEISSSVLLINDYAFEDSGVKILHFNRYNLSTGEITATQISSENAFASVILDWVVFPNFTVADYYKGVDGYKSLDESLLDKFTYEVEYIYHKDTNACDENLNNCINLTYYNGEILSEVPADLDKTGYNFTGWFSKSTNDPVNVGNKVNTESSVYEIIPKWKLMNPTVTIGTYVGNEEEQDHTIVFAGIDQYLQIVVNVVHPLSYDTENYKVSYKWQKNGVVASPLSETSNIYKISQVGQSGNYSCVVTVTYLNESSESITASVDAIIETRDLIINVNPNETEYGTYVGPKLQNGSYFTIDASTPLADNQIIKSSDVETFIFTGGNKDIKSRQQPYEGVLELLVKKIVYEDDAEEIDYSSNYDIHYNYGDLTVNPKQIVISLNENKVVTYGESVDLTIEQEDVVYNGISNTLVITLNRDKPNVDDAGEYEILTISVDNPNYKASFSQQSANKVIIMPKQVSVEWSGADTHTYDGTEKTFNASFKDVEGNNISLAVNITKEGQNSKVINAGTYVVEATKIAKNDNYELTNAVRIVTVNKAKTEFISAETQYVQYNGKPQRVTAIPNHNEGTVVYGNYDMCKNVTSNTQNPCEIEVSVVGATNYTDEKKMFYLVITPYELQDIAPSVFEIAYGSAIGSHNLKKVVEGQNGEQVVVCFYKEGSSSELNVGYYNIGGAYVYENLNYTVRELTDEEKMNKISIVPAEVEVRFYFYEGLTYDGTEKTIPYRVFGTTEDVGIIISHKGENVTNITAKNAGHYRYDVTLTNSNYCITGNDYIEFEVAKANYNVKGLKLKDKEVKFNFKSHVIQLEGELPEGVSVKYTIDDNAGNGTYLPFEHTVKVTFEGDFDNYNYIEPLVAKLYIDMTWVFVTLGVFVGVVILAVVAFILLVKFEIIRLTNKVQRRRLRRVIRNNKAILAINEMFKNNRKAIEGNKDEDSIIIEDDVKFVKNQVEVITETIISLSFVDKLFRSEQVTKECYSEVKNELLSYEGIVSKIKRDFETFYLNNIPVAKLDVVEGELQVCFALDPTQYKKEEYHHQNVSKVKEFSAVPLKLMVNSIESLRHAKMFVRIIRKREKLKAVSNFIRTDYVKVYTAKDNTFKLFKKARVKKGSKESLED